VNPSPAETVGVYCSRCDVRVAAKVTASHIDYSAASSLLRRRAADDSEVTLYSIATCPGCSSVFLTRRSFSEIPGEFTASREDPEVLYPSPARPELGDLPEFVRRSFTDAARLYTGGIYGACVGKCRQCLAAVCQEQGAPPDGILEQLTDLRKRDVIDGKLLSWANELLLSCDERGESHVDQESARAMLEFVEAVVLYVFSVQARFERFEKLRGGVRTP